MCWFPVCCVGSALRDELITRAEVYRVYVCLSVRDVETPRMRRRGPDLGCCATHKNRRSQYQNINITLRISYFLLASALKTSKILTYSKRQSPS